MCWVMRVVVVGGGRVGVGVGVTVLRSSGCMF